MEINESETDSTFNVYVGAETGVLKGIYFGEETPRLKNFHGFDKITDATPVRTLTWNDPETKKEILVAFKNQMVKIYNTKLRAFSTSIKLSSNRDVVGVHSYMGSYLVGFEDGKIDLWSFSEDKNVLEFVSGENLSVIQQCPHNKHIFATGGKENDLKIWNLEAPESTVPIFSAKNVPHDELDLRIPVWVQGLTFLPQSSELVAVCTRYGQVRLYDPKVNNRNRPVINMQFMDHPLMSISTTQNNRQVLIGSSQGKMGLVDLRNVNNGNVVHHFGGFGGSIRSISAHPDSPYFVSCGLDRHLYLHHLNQKKPIKKLYLKSRLNCVLMTDRFQLESHETAAEKLKDTVHWQNIDMEALDIPSSSNGSNQHSVVSPKKRKLKH